MVRVLPAFDASLHNARPLLSAAGPKTQFQVGFRPRNLVLSRTAFI